MPPVAQTGPVEPSPAPVTVPSDAPRYAVDPQASEIRLLVYRDGPLARFGHNHVIVGPVYGEIRGGESAAARSFRLEIAVQSLIVEPQAARAEEGEEFAAQVSDAARRGTRDNMLGPDVLDAERHPLIRIESVSLVGPPWGPTVTARVVLRGAARDLRFPASVVRQGDALVVIAGFAISQTAFGIKPYSALNGGLRVRDALDVRVRVVARRAAEHSGLAPRPGLEPGPCGLRDPSERGRRLG